MLHTQHIHTSKHAYKHTFSWPGHALAERDSSSTFYSYERNSPIHTYAARWYGIHSQTIAHTIEEPATAAAVAAATAVPSRSI